MRQQAAAFHDAARLYNFGGGAGVGRGDRSLRTAGGKFRNNAIRIDLPSRGLLVLWSWRPMTRDLCRRSCTGDDGATIADVTPRTGQSRVSTTRSTIPHPTRPTISSTSSVTRAYDPARSKMREN
jgi:hypothetical protein